MAAPQGRHQRYPLEAISGPRGDDRSDRASRRRAGGPAASAAMVACCTAGGPYSIMQGPAYPIVGRSDRSYRHNMRASVHLSTAGHRRICCARQWLEAKSPCEPVVIVGSNSDAATEITRRFVEEKGAVFGWRRPTPPQLAAVLARPLLVQRNLVAISRTGTEALVTRVVQDLASGGELGRYAEIALGPGFARAVTDVLIELRLAGHVPETIERVAPELAAILEHYQAQLAVAGFADWPSVLNAATEVAQHGDSNQLLGLATLFLDVRIASEADSKLIAAVCSRARSVIATVPTGDETTAGFFRDHLKFDVIDLDRPPTRRRSARTSRRARSRDFSAGSSSKIRKRRQ